MNRLARWLPSQERFERWLWTRHRLRLTWKGEIAWDSLVLAALFTAAYLAWILLAAAS